jgi:hypothetical protein
MKPGLSRCKWLAAICLVLTSCSGRDAGDRELPIPKGATALPLKTYPQVWIGTPRGFWMASGGEDAPSLRLLLTDGKHYVDIPSHVALELRCDPWAGGLIFGSAAVRLSMEPPHPYPGNQLILKAGRLTLSGPAHPRTFGATDTSIPGSFVTADEVNLHELANAKTMEVHWGQRFAILPAPSAEVLSDFTTRCGEAFEFGGPR